jgi:hypothetical protein
VTLTQLASAAVPERPRAGFRAAAERPAKEATRGAGVASRVVLLAAVARAVGRWEMGELPGTPGVGAAR